MATDEDVVQDTLLRVSDALCRLVEVETDVSDGGNGRGKKLGKFLVAHVFWQSSCSKLLCRAFSLAMLSLLQDKLATYTSHLLPQQSQILIDSALWSTRRACAGQHVHCAGQVSAVQRLYDTLLAVREKGLTGEL